MKLEMCDYCKDYRYAYWCTHCTGEMAMYWGHTPEEAYRKYLHAHRPLTR